MNSWIARLKVKAEGSKSNKVPTTRFVKQGSKCRIGEGGGQMMIVRALREQYRKKFYQKNFLAKIYATVSKHEYEEMYFLQEGVAFRRICG